MTLADLLRFALGNIGRMKVRTGLTVAGVTIGVGMMVSMLGFGVGMQKNLQDRFQELGLFETVLVLPGATPAADDKHAAPPLPLDEALVARARGVGGVASVQPFETFSASLEVNGARRPVTVSAVAPDTRSTAAPGLEAGRFFSGPTARELLLRTDVAQRFGYKTPAQAVGTSATLITTKSNLSQLARRGQQLRADPLAAFGLPGMGPLETLRLDNLASVAARLDVAKGLRTMREVLQMLDEIERSPFGEVRYPFTVVGVLSPELRHLEVREVTIPIGTSSELEHLGLTAITDLVGDPRARGRYSMLMVRTRSVAATHGVVRAFRDMRLNVVSFAEQFDEIRKAMLLFDLFVAAIALVAVVVAALGIINTLVMATVERTREIGVLKSLGAEDGHIRLLFLAEAGVIGLAGGVLGDALGYAVTRIGSAVARYIMLRQGEPAVELFHVPWWLLLFGVAFGALVSLVAGVYPAHRAARIDPVRALRHD